MGDFEKELKKETGKEPSSSSDEDEIIADAKPKSKVSLSSKIKKQREKILSTKSSKTFKMGLPPKPLSLFEKVKHAKKEVELEELALSESDSSDEDVSKQPRKTKSNVPIRNPVKSLYFEKKQNESDQGGNDDMLKLMALAGNLEKINEPWKEDPEKQSSSKTK